MANQERGEARLVVSGHVYTMRLTVGTCCELEDRLGQDFDTVTERVNRGRWTELRWLLWAVLQPYHAQTFVSVEDVTPIIDGLGRFALRSRLSAFLLLNTDTEPREDAKGQASTEPERGSLWHRLYITARQHGIPSQTFWAFSLRELWAEMAAIRQRSNAEREGRITQAWWIAALVWQKSLPDLSDLLESSQSHAPKPQTWQEMRAAFHAAVRARDAAEAKKKAS